jgi:hypothetical protein
MRTNQDAEGEHLGDLADVLDLAGGDGDDGACWRARSRPRSTLPEDRESASRKRSGRLFCEAGDGRRLRATTSQQHHSSIRQDQPDQTTDAKWGHFKPSRRGQCKPSFSVIDSPRKNFGSNEADAESMRRFYRTLWALRAQRTGTDFQVIVADNDSPSEERDQFELLELDRDHPLVDAARLRGGRAGDAS